MPYRLPYPYFPNLGLLMAGDIVPVLREPTDEGSATVQDIADYVQPYKKYVANITQSGGGDPTAVEFENTLGATVTYIRGLSGDYLLTASASVFTDDYTWVIMGNGQNYNHNIYVKRSSDTEIQIITLDGNTQTDDILNDTAIEIRVYNMPPP